MQKPSFLQRLHIKGLEPSTQLGPIHAQRTAKIGYSVLFVHEIEQLSITMQNDIKSYQKKFNKYPLF
jgi:hypothetical protein